MNNFSLAKKRIVLPLKKCEIVKQMEINNKMQKMHGKIIKKN